jgi:ribosomal silencing factor RsfS
MGADRISWLYSYCLLARDILCKDLEVQGWHVCTEFFVVCLITLVGHVGAMVQYVKRRKYRNVDGEHGVGRGN